MLCGTHDHSLATLMWSSLHNSNDNRQQGGQPPGKPGKIMEFESGHGKVRENVFLPATYLHCWSNWGFGSMILLHKVWINVSILTQDQQMYRLEKTSISISISNVTGLHTM